MRKCTSSKNALSFLFAGEKKHKSHLFINREQKLVVILGKRKCWSVVAEYRNVCVRVCVHCCVGLWHGGCNGSEQSVCWTRICAWLHLQRTGWLLLVVGVCALLWYLSVRLSVPSIYSSSNMQLVCCSLGTGVGYQSKAANASYWLLINVCCLCWSAAVSSQRYAVVQGMTVSACLLHLLAIKPLPCGNCFFIFYCRLWGIMHPWFNFRFWRYIYCLLVYIVCFPTYPFSSHFS